MNKRTKKLHILIPVPALLTSTGVKVAQSLVVSHFVARASGLDCNCEDYQFCQLIVQGVGMVIIFNPIKKNKTFP